MPQRMRGTSAAAIAAAAANIARQGTQPATPKEASKTVASPLHEAYATSGMAIREAHLEGRAQPPDRIGVRGSGIGRFFGELGVNENAARHSAIRNRGHLITNAAYLTEAEKQALYGVDSGTWSALAKAASKVHVITGVKGIAGIPLGTPSFSDIIGFPENPGFGPLPGDAGNSFSPDAGFQHGPGRSALGDPDGPSFTGWGPHAGGGLDPSARTMPRGALPDPGGEGSEVVPGGYLDKWLKNPTGGKPAAIPLPAALPKANPATGDLGPSDEQEMQRDSIKEQLERSGQTPPPAQPAARSPTQVELDEWRKELAGQPPTQTAPAGPPPVPIGTPADSGLTGGTGSPGGPRAAISSRYVPSDDDIGRHRPGPRSNVQRAMPSGELDFLPADDSVGPVSPRARPFGNGDLSMPTPDDPRPGNPHSRQIMLRPY
jgi:hypothetical protein